jgi:MFS family permease
MRLYSPDHQQFRDAQSLMETKTYSAWAKPLTLAAMSLGYGVVQLDVTIVNTALNSMGSALGGGVSELQWVVSTYTIAFASLILTAGALGDRIGAKKVFMAGFAVFTAASLACALAPTSVFLIAARAVQGLGAAILVPNSLALLSHAYPDAKERGRAVGTWAAGQPRADGGPAGRRRPDRAVRLAKHIPGQPADRLGRSMADLALRDRHDPHAS